MSNCRQTSSEASIIADALVEIGPRTVEGDQGRVTMHSVQDAIRAVEYDRRRTQMKDRKGIQAVLRTISNNRLLSHDGPAT